jgi:hypothetical protein
MAGWKRVLSHRRLTAGALLILGGLLVVGLWTVAIWTLPGIMVVMAVALAWLRSVQGVLVALVGLALFLWLGMTLAWVVWSVGMVLVCGGILMLAQGRRPPEPKTESNP